MAKKKQMDKLSQEVSQELAAGMSYGKWKAMQPRVPFRPKEPLESYREFTCEHCGVKFIRYDRKSQKYCGDRCKNAAFRLRKRMKEIEQYV